MLILQLANNFDITPRQCYHYWILCIVEAVTAELISTYFICELWTKADRP